MEAAWNEIKAVVKENIPGHSFRMWIEPLKYIKNDKDCLVVSSPNPFSRKRVQDHYSSIIDSEVKKVFGKDCRFSITVLNGNGKGNHRQKANKKLQLSLPNMNVCQSKGCFLRKEFTFDQFVVGNNNDFAYSASLSLASKKDTYQNSLFLLSHTGMGKSHLSQAIGHQILAKYPKDRVYYVTAEDFSNEMIQAFRNNCIEKFKSKYRNNCDVLLLEDVHYLTGKERTQIELALTLDSLFESNKKVIFSSCYLPADIPKLNDKLRSRLSSGLISTIDPPDFKTRVRIIKKKSKAKGYHIPEDVTGYLASELTDDVRQLESGLFGVAAKSSLLSVPLDLSLAASVVKNIVRNRKTITLSGIKKLVCKNYRISVSDIESRSRKQTIVQPRQIAIYLSRRYTDLSLQTIGKSFNRYHATALHSIGAVERGLREDATIQKKVDFFCKKLESGKF
ncbi:MAG: chromosomal replication initiator protein DnaA [Thermodesulfobacteriota bacterium]|nr:chromosomal replication initiator protein DnaA [Thermodesulfobacteriota bacterium]